MKEKTIWITLAIVIAVLALGVAYAAITTQTLNVVGNVTTATSDANFNVEITEITKQDMMSTAGTLTSNIMATGKTATMDISGLTTKGQTITAKVAVTNNSADLDAVITSDVVHTNSTWFAVSNLSSQNEVIKPGKTAYVLVEIRLLDTPATDAEVAASKDTVTITIDANAQ